MSFWILVSGTGFFCNLSKKRLCLLNRQTDIVVIFIRFRKEGSRPYPAGFSFDANGRFSYFYTLLIFLGGKYYETRIVTANSNISDSCAAGLYERAHHLLRH
jgi:hypothetical protein